MEPDETHSWVLRELADEVAKLLSIISEKLWWSGEVGSICKKGSIILIFKGRLRELQDSQSHFCAHKDHGANPPGNYPKACGKLSWFQLG